MSNKIIRNQQNLDKVIKRQITLWDRPKIKEKYSYIYRDDFNDLERGIIILRISKQEFNMPWITAEEISSLLVDVFNLSSTPIGIKRAFAKAGGAKRTKKPIISKRINGLILYKLSQPGEILIDGLLGKGFLKVLYLGPNSHREAHQKLYDLVRKLKGKELNISDPYYGIDVLNVIEEIVRAGKKVKFLSHHTDEQAIKFSRELEYLRKHYPNKIEVRVYPKRELHDRYILADDSFVIVGHGIKDIGNKESLVLVVDDRFGKDARKELKRAFWNRWTDRGCSIL